MLAFIKWLSEQMAAVTEEMIAKEEPEDEPKQGDEIITILDEGERRAYVVKNGLLEKALTLFEAHQLKHDFNLKLEHGECKRCKSDLLMLKADYDLINAMLLHSIGSRMKNHAVILAICKGWRVMKLKEGGEKEGNPAIVIEITTKKGFPPFGCN